jgi:hypothetical protein
MKSGEKSKRSTGLPLRNPSTEGLVSTRARLERLVDEQMRSSELTRAGEAWTPATDETEVPTAVREGYFWLLAGIIEALDFSAQAERCLSEAGPVLTPLTVRRLRRLLSVATAAATESWATI